MRLLLPALLVVSFAGAQSPVAPSLIPLPVEMRLTGGTCDLMCGWGIQGDPSGLVEILRSETTSTPKEREVDCERSIPIRLMKVAYDTLVPDEYYTLVVHSGGIDIEAPSDEGLFRGSRTLIQLLEQGEKTGSIPCLSIIDYPRFPWRGMHLDPCRHFWSVEFTKKYIDLLARYKMNTFHWHLTDDQGWRIEIKQYPKLTEVGGWRSGSQVGPYSRREYDSIPYGGFYTQEQIREVMAYAAARHITVVPEIEMPGHALAALAAYPELGCMGGPYEVQKGWGVFQEVFCPTDSTIHFLENVLSEVMDLFPSELIHIGGDECPKESWKKCPRCQSRMKAEGLKDEHELQSYFIQRMEKFVNSKGRKIIGWDEILEGGLAPNAAVMSWRGTEGGVAAAKQKHNVVMSPGSHCYFDHYQGDPANEPLAIGGHTTVQKVYSYEPVPKELTAEEGTYILGAQGNVWSEYILTPEHVEYMAVPRMLALAEVLWTPKEKRDEADFVQRLEKEFPRLDALKVNASRSLYQVRLVPSKEAQPGAIALTLSSGANSKSLMFSRAEGSDDPESLQTLVDGFYQQPLSLNQTCRIEGFLVDTVAGELKSTYPRAKQTFHFNKATAQEITLSEQPNERYNEGGAFTLVDGITAQEKRVNTEWLGWRKSVTITVDLGSVQDINYIGIGALNETYGWIHVPKVVEFSVSTDGKTFTDLGMDLSTMTEIPIHYPDHRPDGKTFSARSGRHTYKTDKAAKGRFVRINVQHIGTIPAGFPGAGSPAWLFLDEIEVR